jgi:hypothetical protein
LNALRKNGVLTDKQIRDTFSSETAELIIRVCIPIEEIIADEINKDGPWISNEERKRQNEIALKPLTGIAKTVNHLRVAEKIDGYRGFS